MNVPLTKGYVAVIDDADAEIVHRHTWKAMEVQPGKVYAATELPMVNRVKGKTVYMHQLISGSKYIDHRDGNRLNNRRSNLRPATTQQNAANVRKYKGASKYKGVAHARRGGWRAYIRVNYKHIHLGSFQTEEEAAKAYDNAAKIHFGEFARLNLVEQEY